MNNFQVSRTAVNPPGHQASYQLTVPNSPFLSFDLHFVPGPSDSLLLPLPFVSFSHAVKKPSRRSYNTSKHSFSALPRKTLKTGYSTPDTKNQPIDANGTKQTETLRARFARGVRCRNNNARVSASNMTAASIFLPPFNGSRGCNTDLFGSITSPPCCPSALLCPFPQHAGIQTHNKGGRYCQQNKSAPVLDTGIYCRGSMDFDERLEVLESTRKQNQHTNFKK